MSGDKLPYIKVISCADHRYRYTYICIYRCVTQCVAAVRHFYVNGNVRAVFCISVRVCTRMQFDDVAPTSNTSAINDRAFLTIFFARSFIENIVCKFSSRNLKRLKFNTILCKKTSSFETFENNIFSAILETYNIDSYINEYRQLSLIIALIAITISSKCYSRQNKGSEPLCFSTLDAHLYIQPTWN